ncbi:MAG: hypothetical protein RSE64_07510 [Oscillospiraceae bacterium]
MVAYFNAMKRLWVGSCTAYVREPTVNETNGRSEFSERIAFRNEPCRLSFKSAPAVSPNSEAMAVTQTIQLFMAKTASVPNGSKLIITQNGVTGEYGMSGVPAVYEYHQEITLELFRGWA